MSASLFLIESSFRMSIQNIDTAHLQKAKSFCLHSTNCETKQFVQAGTSWYGSCRALVCISGMSLLGMSRKQRIVINARQALSTLNDEVALAPRWSQKRIQPLNLNQL
jgi:hypothetical protein